MKKILLKYPDYKKIHLAIGDGGIFEKPYIVTTVLGSCVSVTFFCSEKKIGAIFHAVLPCIPGNDKKRSVKNPYQYVDTSINHILQSFHERGVKNNQIEAKLFGGSQVISHGLINTGANNIMTAYEVLAANNIKIAASDVGGNTGRKLVFISNTGEVYIKNHRKQMFERSRRKASACRTICMPSSDLFCNAIKS